MARKVIKYVVIALVAVNVAIIAIVLLGDHSTPVRHAMPNPNGYDDFVKAGKLVTGAPYDFGKMNQAELAGLVSTNEEALKLVRAGLSNECRVPDDYSKDYIARLMTELGTLKELSNLICAEGRLAELEGRTNDAIKIYLEGLRFGQDCNRGGLIISKLVGTACEAVPLQALGSLVNSVDAPQARKLAQTIETIDANEAPIEESVDEEKRWRQKEYSWRGELIALVQHSQLKQAEDRAMQKMKAGAVRRRKLMTLFAARAYELEHGKPPQSLAELVPSYLKAIPLDPTTGTNLVYSP